MIKKVSVLAAVGMSALSCAQSGLLDEPTNIAFRIGYVYPVDNVMRNISNSYIGVGVDLFPSGFTLIHGAETSISFDWFGKSGSGAKGNAFPVLINQRWYSDDNGSGRSYFFVGAGVAFIDLVNSDTVLAGRIGYGKEFGQNTFGELTFNYSDGATGGGRATALSFHFGYRF